MTPEQIIDRETFRLYREAQASEAVRNHLLSMPSQSCTAGHITFGGRCLNCGGVNGHAKQPGRKS